MVLRIGSSTPTAAGDRLEVQITGATNSTAGAHTFDIETSSDTTPVTTPSYTLLAAQAVTSPSVVPSTTAAGATGVSYNVGFTTSSTGQLVFPEVDHADCPGRHVHRRELHGLRHHRLRNLGAGVVTNDGATVVLRIGSSTPTAAGDQAGSPDHRHDQLDRRSTHLRHRNVVRHHIRDHPELHARRGAVRHQHLGRAVHHGGPRDPGRIQRRVHDQLYGPAGVPRDDT